MDSRSQRRLFPLLAILFLLPQLICAEFSFYATLRAGRPAGGDWQMGLGTDPNASQSTGNFRWSASDPSWRDNNEFQRFRVGFNATSQNAYITVWDSNDIAFTRNLANTGAALSSTAIWTFPSANFFVSESAPTGALARSITVNNFTLSSGVQVLSGSLPVSLGASGPPASTASMSAPLVLNPAAAGGSWFIDGRIRFTGVTGQGAGNAKNSELQYFLRAMGSDVPEVRTVFMTGIGLVLAAAFGKLRRIG